MATKIRIFKRKGTYTVVSKETTLKPRGRAQFRGPPGKPFRLRFSSKVFDNLDPGMDHESNGNVWHVRAVNDETDSDYTIGIDGVSLDARIVVKEPPALTLTHLIAALLTGLLVGVAGTWWYFTR